MMKFDYEPVIGKKDKVSAIVGMSSLVGVGKDRPVSFGNYFSFYQTHEQMMTMDPAARVWNFWAENLKAARDMFLTDGMVDIIQYEKGCIILDKRIPEDWYYNKLCFTGGWAPAKEDATEIYDILGDPTNELEQFIDPVEYHRKRGATYDPKTGIIRMIINDDSRIITGTFT